MAAHKKPIPRRTGWAKKLPGVKNAVLPPQTTRPNPLVVGEVVFASVFAPGAVWAVERKTGRPLWMNQLDSFAAPSVSLQGRNLYANSSRTLYALDPDTGNVRWEFSPISEPGEWIYSSPSVRAGRVFIGDRRGYFHCLAAKTGRKLWFRLSSKGDNNQVNSTALVMSDRVISANNKGAVVCYSTATGQTIWRQKVDGACTHELLHLRSTVIVAANSLYAIDLKAGAVCNKWSFPGKKIASVAVIGSRVAIILGTDFQAQASAWNRPSAFNGDLVILEQDREIARRTLNGTPSLRASTETDRLYAVTHSEMNVIDPSDASMLTSRRGQIALPTISGGQLYGISVDGVLFSEPAP
jgi:outer membrane protein assembly factor BamB